MQLLQKLQQFDKKGLETSNGRDVLTNAGKIELTGGSNARPLSRKESFCVAPIHYHDVCNFEFLTESISKLSFREFWDYFADFDPKSRGPF